MDTIYKDSSPFSFLENIGKEVFIKCLKHVLWINLFGLFSKTLKVIKNCTGWSEMSVIRLPEVIASFISLKNMLSINAFNLVVM